MSRLGQRFRRRKRARARKQMENRTIRLPPKRRKSFRIQRQVSLGLAFCLSLSLSRRVDIAPGRKKALYCCSLCIFGSNKKGYRSGARGFVP